MTPGGAQATRVLVRTLRTVAFGPEGDVRDYPPGELVEMDAETYRFFLRRGSVELAQ